MPCARAVDELAGLLRRAAAAAAGAGVRACGDSRVPRRSGEADTGR